MKKVFIIHGWTYTTDKWQEFFELLKAAGFEPVMLNVPGLTEASDKVWDLESYVEWLNDKLANEQDPVVVGHSNGGRIAIAFAAKYPNRIGRLILVGSAGLYHNEIGIRIKRAVFGSLAKAGKAITSSDFLRSLLYKLAGEKDYKKANGNMRKTMANVISRDLTPELVAITVPTLLIWGRQDTATPLSDGEKMKQLVKSSELYIIDEAGHSPHFTHAKKMADKILEFIK